MTGRCQPDPVQMQAGDFGAAEGGHWCTGWQGWTRDDGSLVIWCPHKVAIELEVAV